MSSPSTKTIHPTLVKGITFLTGPWTWENLGGWLFVILAILFIKGCIIDQYAIPSDSMEPTLNGDPRFFRGDRVLVNKWIYGPRIPFTTKRLWKWAEPNRWDIVVFRSKEATTDYPILIKRVVGLPGERVHIKNGHIYINEELVLPPEPLRDILQYTTALHFGSVERKRIFLKLAQKNKPLPILNPAHPPVILLYEAMQKVHPLVSDQNIDTLDDEQVESLTANLDKKVLNLIDDIYDFVQPEMRYGIHTEDAYSLVPENHVFLLGDNSTHSLDGRMYGWVPQNHLYGRAFAVWWPWSRRKDFTGFSTTWWGKLLLYGTPSALILLELVIFAKKKLKHGN